VNSELHRRPFEPKDVNSEFSAASFLAARAARSGRPDPHPVRLHSSLGYLTPHEFTKSHHRGELALQ
jgi:hypothetical protein